MYSSGRSCHGAVKRQSRRGQPRGEAHVEGIVLAHLTHELFANPGAYFGPAFLIEPPEPLHCPEDPLAFTLFR